MVAIEASTGEARVESTRSPDDPPITSTSAGVRLPEWLQAIYPFTPRSLTFNGVRMSYLDEGKGPVVLMLHGNPTWSFFYRNLVERLRSRFRVIVPDHIGCGLSDKPQSFPYTLATRIDAVTHLVDSLSLANVNLVVHDWGGAIGMGWATTHAERVRRLVIFNSAAFPGGRCPWRIHVCRWPILGAFGVRRLNLFSRAALWMATARPLSIPVDVRRAYLFPYGTYADRIAVHEFVRDIPLQRNARSYATLARIAADLPHLRDRATLLCWGMRDFCFTPWFLDRWQQYFPAAEVHRFDDAGHYLLEDAGEAIVPIVERFLTR